MTAADLAAKTVNSLLLARIGRDRPVLVAVDTLFALAAATQHAQAQD